MIMRRLTTLLLLLISTTVALAQRPYTAYASIQGYDPCYIDYGQSNMRKNWLVDSDGKTIYFSSIIGALNYMSERGWTLLQPHTSVRSNVVDNEKIESKTIWIFSKEVSSPEEITEGITMRLMSLDKSLDASE